MRAPHTDVMPFTRILREPWERLASDTPTWGWVLAWLGGFWQFLAGDAFSSLLALILCVAAADYYYGVKAARLSERFSPVLAQRGWHGKMSGVVLLLGIRLFEGWAAGAGFVDSKGGLATALGIALLTVDLQSIAHHRESFGASPIPILSNILAWMRNVAAVKLPPARREFRTAASGDWRNPDTWENGLVPGDGDRVVLRHHVTVDTPFPPRAAHPPEPTADEVFDHFRDGSPSPSQPPTT